MSDVENQERGMKRKRGDDDVTTNTTTSCKKIKTHRVDIDVEEKISLVYDDTVLMDCSDTYTVINYTPKNTALDPDGDNTMTESGVCRKRGVTVEPINKFDDKTRVVFDTGFTLQRDDDDYTCTCDEFHAVGDDNSDRPSTCKHLREYLGDYFEDLRVSKKKKSIPQHITVNVLLAHKYDEKSDIPTNWWISEKLDGVRAFWNGQCFYSRLGNAFFAPAWFTQDLPRDITLDGELFGGRGQFQDTVSVVKSGPDSRWSNVRFHVFDCPSLGSKRFEERMAAIIDIFQKRRPKYALFVEQIRCRGKNHLDQKLEEVLNVGGEGLMIRKPGSVYEMSRSKTLLKIKKFYDAEAVVIGHEKGKGSNQHRCGALRCRMACGEEFSVGSGMTNQNRKNPPKKGSIITYRFQELSKRGKPRFPTYVGVRIDMNEPKDAEIRPIMCDD